MYQTRGAAWIGFEEAQKTINALKEEVEEAEKKLSKAKQALKHDRGDASSRINRQTSSTGVMHNISNRNEQQKHFVKHVIPQQKPHVERPHKKRGKFTAVPKIIKFSSDSEDQPNLVSPNVRSTLPADIELSKITSSDTSNSYKNTKYDSSSSEKTSSLIADTYANIDSKLSNIIERSENKKNTDASKITFTPWEEDFLKSCIDISDAEVASSQSDKPLENITNDMEWTPVFNNNKLPRTKKIADDGLLTLKQIIDRQKRLHEEVCSKSEGHYSPSENVDPPSKLNSDTKTSNLEDLTFTDIEAEAQVRPPPTRKVRLVTALPRYRGFSTPGSFSTSNLQSKLKYSKKPSQNIADKKAPAFRKQTKKMTSRKTNESKSPVQNNNQTVQKETKNLASENKIEEKSDSNSYDIRTSDTLPKEISDSKLSDQILVEKDKENSLKDYSTDINITSNIESQATSVDTENKTEEQYNVPQFFPVSKSVKRKAFKVHAEEKMAPSPKIRHYDTKAVRDYIKKKKAERRKRHLEQHKKSVEEIERKKESLQKLMEFQKQSLTMPSTKTLSPSKASQKKIELKRTEIQLLPELNLLHKEKIENLPLDAAKKPPQISETEKCVDPTPHNTSQKEINWKSENSKRHQKTPSSKFSLKQSEEKILINAAGVEPKAGKHDKTSSKANYENNKDEHPLTIPVESEQKDVSLTSFEYQSANLSDYISSINTTTELSELPSYDGFLPQKFESEKFKLPSGKLKPAEALKSLVKSIDEMTAPYEHLIRTKAWVDQSPPPPNRKSITIQIERIPYAHSCSKGKSSTDFVVDVAKSLHSFGENSFIQQVSNIGDTSDLYAKILGQSTDLNENTHVEAAETSSHTAIDTCPEYSLIEGSLESDSSLSKENEVHSKINSNQNRPVIISRGPVTPEFEATKITPDPFNFINTWNRKPLGIPLSPKEALLASANQFSPDAKKTIDVRTDVQRNNTKSLTLTSSMHSSFVSDISEIAQKSVRQSASSTTQREMTDEKKSASEYSSHTPVPSSYTSVTTGSLTSETISSRNSPEDPIDEPTESNHQEVNVKAASPSESSISEVVSVIANSKNGEKEHTDVSVKNGSSTASSVEEEKIPECDVQEVEFADDVKHSSSEVVQKSPEGSIQEVLEESPPRDGIEQKQNLANSGESSPSVISETKSHSMLSEQKESFEENVSEVSAPSKKDVTIDFTQPIRLTMSNGVPKSLKILKESMRSEEQYLHTQVVTRVASEAAAAAASSAVIAVFETQKKLLSKEHEGTRLLFPGPSGIKNSQKDRSESSVSPKTSNDSGSPNYEREQFQRISDDTVEEEIEEKASSVSTVKDFNYSNEGDVLSDHASISTKASTSHVVSEELSVHERLKERTKVSKKASGNLSSPSPASLSENDSISSVALVSTNSAPSSSMLNESILSDDSFARLTEDVVRKMSYEEKRRANHQLAVLRFEEKTLVENARSQMALLESIKKKLRDKGANAKASLIKKKQKELILRLRQERAQLRCMQEAYRGMCEMHHTMLTEEKKVLHSQDILAYQLKKNKEKSHASKTSTEPKLELSRIRSDSSSTSAILTEEESREEEEAEVTGLDVQMSKSMTSNSQDSIIETIASEKAKSIISTHSQTPKISPTSFPQSKQGTSQSNPALHSTHANESALQGLKKLEASKRHLTKREQRILQRRKHVERLLQWQTKLDSEEMAVRELEQKALELVDTSKKKTKYYVSSSPSATPIDDGKIPENSPKMSEEVDGSVLSDKVTLQHSTKSTVPTSIQSSSTLKENTVATASGGSIDEVLSRKTSNEPESSSALSSSSIQEVEKSQSVNSSIKTAENTAESSFIDEVTTNETSPNIKSDSKKDLTSDVYSESFESSAPSQNTLSPVSNSPAIKTSTPSPGSTKKERNFSIKSPLAPRNFRRHDSSGSDDSYTVSHSETASDQSDIEVRIHALSEELRRRRYEAEKLKREQKRKYREHLKGTELSLQKQVEAYNQYIQQVKAELEQIESVPSQSQVMDISSVKPQIKWPRPEHVIDSRRIRKKSMTSDTVLLEKRSIDHVSSSPESAESAFEFPKKQGKFLKKLYPETKEKPSIDKVSKQDIPEKDEHKTSDTNESASPEKISLNKISEVISETTNKLSRQSKDETEIAESYESNSSIGTADPISEKSSISVKEVISKSTYQSDSFTSSSSTISQSLRDSETLGKQAVQKISDSASETETVEKISEFPTEAHEDSENSHDSRKNATTNESAHSSGEYTSESSVNTITNTESVKEDFESGSLEEENSECSSSSPSKKSSDKISVKTQIKSPESNTSELPSASKDNKNSAVSEKAKHPIKDLKSETFIVNVVTYLSGSMLNDAIRTMINLSNNYLKPISIMPSGHIIKQNTFNTSSLSSVKKLSEKSIELIINDLLNLYLKDAFKSIINIANDFKHFSEDGNNTSSNQTLELAATNSLSIESTKSIVTSENAELKNDLATTPIQEKVESGIFKKHTDWLEDGFVTTPWDPQQLEQQLLLQQYPYLYRKIPNKPPPPYTPPATININSQYIFPLPIKKEKPVEKVDPIKHVTKNIDLVVGCIVDALLEGKSKGLMVKEITEANFSSVVDQLELRNPCQITFLNMVFDLTRDIALEIYKETDEKRAPWIRPRKLTPKPKFSTDKGKLTAALQKEVEKALKLLPTESYAEQMRKKSTWATMKLGRKKRDFVDTILISEIKEEEPDWVNYDEEEVAVKIQIAESIFDYLVDDTVNLIKTLESKFHR